MALKKYFESIDLRNLQDPSLPLRQQLQDKPIELEKALEPKVITVPQSVEPTSQGTQAPTQPAPLTTGGSTEQSSKPSPMDSVMKPLFSGNLSVGKMMSIVELAGDMLQEQGDDCIDLLLEQCKLMGLKAEDENTIKYKIILVKT